MLNVKPIPNKIYRVPMSPKEIIQNCLINKKEKGIETWLSGIIPVDLNLVVDGSREDFVENISMRLLGIDGFKNFIHMSIGANKGEIFTFVEGDCYELVAYLNLYVIENYDDEIHLEGCNCGLCDEDGKCYGVAIRMLGDDKPFKVLHEKSRKKAREMAENLCTNLGLNFL